MAKTGGIYKVTEEIRDQAQGAFEALESDDDAATLSANLDELIDKAVLLRDVCLEINPSLAKLA
jgi:hypothetical protein